jgi:hypothetical protein
MTTVFVAGSLSIKRLHKLFLERLQSVVASQFQIVVGDADGADKSIQNALLEMDATNVTVYCSGVRPRNNVGSWPIETVASDKEPGSRAFFTAKDVEMARVADYGLMMWDAKSTGTLSNVIELLSNDHASRVFVNKDHKFITVTDAATLKELINKMSVSAREKAEDKIALSNKLKKIENKQFRMAL